MRIDWQHVRKIFGQVNQLSAAQNLRTGLLDFSASAREGITVLLGPKGSGKTTLLKLTALQLVPDDGRVTFSLGGKQPRVWSRRNIQKQETTGLYELEQCLHYTPHLKRLNQSATVETALLRRAQLMRVSCPRKKSAELIARWGLAGYRKMQVSQLSGTVLKRYLLAYGLIAPAPVWLLDEPTAELDPWGRYLLIQELKKRAKGQITLIAVAEDMDLAEQANDLILLEAGVCRRAGNRKILTSSVPEGTVRAWYEAMQAFSYLRKQHQF
ncbi:MAG: ATP-binding cassette domain-containing protein [Thermoactinomyces sp.]